jgi:hypothetical protein
LGGRVLEIFEFVAHRERAATVSKATSKGHGRIYWGDNCSWM